MTRSTVPRPRGRPKDGVSAETRAKLLVEARKAFARDGYDATTNQTIAERVGITTGAIYHYYASKGELYAAVCEEVQRIVFGAFDEAIAGHTHLLDRYASVLDAAVRLNHDDPSIAGFVSGIPAEAQRHPDLARLLAPQWSTHRGFFTRLVDDAVANGELADDVDPRALRDLLDAVLSGLARFSNMTGDVHRHACAVDVLKRFLSGELLRRPD